MPLDSLADPVAKRLSATVEYVGEFAGGDQTEA
jgi:hypothetical protein